MLKSFIIGVVALVIFTTGFAQTPPASIVNGINSLFQAHVDQTQGFVPGHVIRIEKPGQWVYENAAGLASVTPAQATQANMKFKVASISKMFNSVAIFKLIQNGQLNFDAPISTYLPLSVVQGFDDYQNIKIRNLLSHTSGIREPQADFQGRLNYWIFMKRFETIPLDSLLFWSYGDPVGVGKYNYSNANFYVLAEIIKAVTGDSYENYITNNIITPLGLTNTDFKRIPTGSFMRGYLKGTFYETGGVPDGLVGDSLYDFTEASNSWGYGAADLWSNTTDLIKFHKALFGGQLINAEWLNKMKNVLTITGDMGSYGHGMIQFNSYNNGPIYGYGHTGTAFGYGSMLCYIPSLDIYMCSAGNYMKIGQEFLQRDIYNFLSANGVGLNDLSGDTSIQLYPNPVSNTLTIQTNLNQFKVAIYDITGQCVLNKSNASLVDVSALKAGVYVVGIEDESYNRLLTQKIVKQ